MNKTLHFLIPVAALLMLCCCHGNTAQQPMDNNDTIASQEPVTIDSTTVDGLIAYFPQFSRIDLVCGQMPSQQGTFSTSNASAANATINDNIFNIYLTFGVYYKK